MKARLAGLTCDGSTMGRNVTTVLNAVKKG
jgi:hypothetical protein